MVHDFLTAAAPWIFIGLFTAVGCTWMSKRKQ